MSAHVTLGSGYILTDDPPTLLGPDVGVVVRP